LNTLKSSRLAHSLRNRIDKRDRGDIPNWQLIIVIFIGVIIIILNQTAMKTALPQIISDVGVSPSVGQWIVSGYTLLKGLMVPITAFAMTKFRTGSLFTMMMVLFGMGSLVSASGLNFLVILFGTLLQGVAAGMVIPMMQTVILTITSVENRGSAMGWMAVGTGIGPTLGPVLGGWIVDLFSWNILFLTWFAGAAVIVPLSILTVYDVLPSSDPEIDWKQIRNSIIGFGLLLYGLSVVGSSGLGSPLAWISIVVGAIFVVKFVKDNYYADEPMLNVRLFKYKNFALAVILATLMFMMISSLANVMSMYIQTARGLTATISGIVLMPGGLMKAVASPFSGKIYDRFGIFFLGKAGSFLMFLGSLMLMFVNETTSLWLVTLFYVLISLGFGMFNTPLITLGMNALPNDQMSHGTSARQTSRQISASFAITLSFVFIAIFDQFSTSQGEGLSILGVQAGFGVIAFLGLINFILSFFLKDNKPVNEK